MALALFGVGVPVQWLLGGRRPLDERGWAYAPFLGMAVIVLVLQNLVYCNLPITRTAWTVWAAAALLWVPIVRKRQLRACLAACPWRLYGVVLLVYAVHGAGLFALGARAYVGRGWSDQFNYTAQAEFLARLPFRTTLDVAGEKPWLTWPILFKYDRIGAPVLQGFLAVSGGASTKAVFGPLILLSPALTALALYTLARRFGLEDWRALAAAAAGGLLPGLAYLHLECYLSHALAVPLLLLFPLALDEWNGRCTPGALLRAALLLTAVFNLYTEFAIILAGLVVLSLAFVAAGRGPRRRLLAGYAALACSPFLFNWHALTDPGVLTGLCSMVARSSAPVLQANYPWAFTVEGWGRVWLGDLAVVPLGSDGTAVRLFTVAATALAFLGLLRAWRDGLLSACEAWGEADRRRTLGLASCVLALALLPIVVAVKDEDHAYQFYKLLLTISPLWVLGLALLPGPARAAGPGGGRLRVGAVLTAGLLLAAVLTAGVQGTWRMAEETANLQPEPRSNADLMAKPETRRLQDLLERRSGGDVLVAHPYPLLNSWAAYFARRNRVWLGNPVLVDANLIHVVQAARMLSLRDLPGDALIVTGRPPDFANVRTGDVAPVGSGESLRLWRSASRAWVLPLAFRNANGLQQLDGQPYFWVGGDPTFLQVLTGEAGVVTLRAGILPGPSLPKTTRRRMRVRGPDGQATEYALDPGPAVFTLPVPAGPSDIYLEAADAPDPHVQTNGDPRTLLVGVQGLEISFTPAGP